jgi:exodeoxyribonuclease-5
MGADGCGRRSSACFTGQIEQLDWPVRKRFDEFDFGYVLTVNRA